MAKHTIALVFACLALTCHTRRVDKDRNLQASKQDQAANEIGTANEGDATQPSPGKPLAVLLLALSDPTAGWSITPSTNKAFNAQAAMAASRMLEGAVMMNQALWGWKPKRIEEDGTKVFGDGSKILPDGTTILKDLSVLTPEGTLIGDAGVEVNSNRLSQIFRGHLPKSVSIEDDGTKVFAKGWGKILPDGTRVGIDGSKSLPDRVWKWRADGLIVFFDGTQILADGTTLLMDGTRIMPDGSTVTPMGIEIPSIPVNDVLTLREFFAQVPQDRLQRVKHFMEAVKTKHVPKEAAALDGSAPAAAEAAAETSEAAGVLSQEQKDSIRKAFEAIDTDKSGFIEVREFTTVMQALGMQMSAEECEAVFKAFDVNGDSKLSFDEYTKMVLEAMKDSEDDPRVH